MKLKDVFNLEENNYNVVCFLCFPRKISTFNMWIIRFALFCRRIAILLGIYTYQDKIIFLFIYLFK